MLRSLALAVLALCLSASAALARPAMLMQTPRQQAIDIAKKAGFLKAGSVQTLQYRTIAKPTFGQPGKAQITIFGVGSPMTKRRVQIASVKAKLMQGREGWGVIKTGAWQRKVLPR